MINQVTNNVNTTNAFSPFRVSGENIYVQKPFIETQQGVDENKKKRVKQIGYGLAGAVVILGAILLAPKTFRGLFKAAEKKITKLSENPKLTPLQNFYLGGLKVVRHLTKYTKATFNGTPFKDSLIKKALQWHPSLINLDNGITNLFERISAFTSKIHYNQTTAKLDNMFTSFSATNETIPANRLKETVTIEGKTKTVAEWLKEVEQRSTNINNNYQEGFNGNARRKRLVKVNTELKGIDTQVWDMTWGHLIKNVKDQTRRKSLTESFISEALAAPTKIKQEREVEALRRTITNDVNDNFTETKKIMNDIEKFVDFSDKQPRELLKQLRESMQNYKSLKGSEEKAQRVIIKNTIADLLSKLDTHITKSTIYDNKTTQELSEYIRDFKEVLTTRNKGDVQEILTIYKNILPTEAYKQVKTVAGKATKSLNKSVNVETDKLFDKVRDLKIGAAPTDLFNFLSSIGLTALFLGKADNNDERISVGLKYGIPVILTTGVSLGLAIGLVSGGPALAIGIASGIVANKVGEYIDDKRKESNTQKTSLTTIAKDVHNAVKESKAGIAQVV